MSNFNKVILVGNITADIELKETPNGAKVASFSIATNRYWKNKEGMKESSATFHSIVAWNRTKWWPNLQKKAQKFSWRATWTTAHGNPRTAPSDTKRKSWQKIFSSYRVHAAATHFQKNRKPRKWSAQRQHTTTSQRWKISHFNF
mgnify:CR=1 FL=1